METLYVQTASRQYPLHITEGFEKLPDSIKQRGLSGRKICIVTDEHVGALYGEEIKNILAPLATQIDTFVFQPGEEQKHLGTIQQMYDFFLEKKLDRKSLIIALGGGVVGDMAGFAAATYMRGIRYIQAPTTLLAQVDSSTGGKTGVDHGGHKNMVGAFYQPELVYINVNTLKSLPAKEFSSGMAEAVKHGLIQDKGYYQFIQDHKEALRDLDPKTLARLVLGSCKIKASVVSQDERETGLREILNFGHTFGHAVESLSHFQMGHGQCVAVGMVAAMALSRQKRPEVITGTSIAQLKELLAYFQLPVSAPNMAAETVYREMFMDKKTKDNHIDVVLLAEIGKAYTETNAREEELLEAVRFITGR